MESCESGELNIMESCESASTKKHPFSAKHRQQKYRKEWECIPELKNWLQPEKNDCFKARCKICNSTMTAELTVIKLHSKGKKHKLLENRQEKQPKLQKFVESSKSVTESNDVSVAEIKLAAFFAEHNISFLAADHLTSVLKSCFPDSKILEKVQLKRTKLSAVVKNVIGASHKSEIVKKIKTTKFSILCDEATDISSVKTLCIVVRFYDNISQKIESLFWELIQLPSSRTDKTPAANMYEALIETFVAQGIPLDNIIGFGSDGCNMMMGQHNSVASRLRDSCPGIFIMKCICHSLHLCASEACKVLPKRCEDLSRNIYNFFSCSAKRQSQFKQFQIFLDIEIHKILHPAQTRWLSLKAVIDRILEQWDALKLYFMDVSMTERLVAAEQIRCELNDPLVKLFYLFLQWILPKFTALNEYFQHKGVVITTLHSKMCSTYREILLCFLEREYVMRAPTLSDVDPSRKDKFLKHEHLYLGIKISNELNNLNTENTPNLKTEFLNRCQEFLRVSCMELKKRYNFNNELLSVMKIFTPKIALSSKSREAYPTLLPLAKLIPRIISVTAEMELQNIDDEWRRLPMEDLPIDITSEEKCDVFWAKLSELKNELGENEFFYLPNFVLNLLTLPHSNSDCERIFSKINLLKTKTRNHLVTETVNGSLLASQKVNLSGSCTQFSPSADMISRMVKSKLYNSTPIDDCNEDHEIIGNLL